MDRGNEPVQGEGMEGCRARGNMVGGASSYAPTLMVEHAQQDASDCVLAVVPPVTFLMSTSSTELALTRGCRACAVFTCCRCATCSVGSMNASTTWRPFSVPSSAIQASEAYTYSLLVLFYIANEKSPNLPMTIAMLLLRAIGFKCRPK